MGFLIFKCVLLVILCGFFDSIQDATAIPPQRFSNDYLEEEKFIPGFLTLGQKYSIAVGSTVVMPCKINETERSSSIILVWKKDTAVLTAGNLKVTTNPRIRLMPPQQNQIDVGSRSSSLSYSNSYNLEIRDVRVEDAGDYVCQISTIKPREISHILEVLEPPKIDFIAPSPRVDVSKGAAIKLECRASGNPTPKIIWTRKNNMMPNGEANMTGTVLEMMHVDRHNVGHYKCTADNRVGQPDTREIFLNVLYPPEIEIEKNVVHTGAGYEAQLTCVVHGEPTPHVVWYKETTQLGTTEQHSQQVRGNRYNLIIRNVTHNDLGNYTCRATNTLGNDRAGLMLSGHPSVCTFDSPSLSNYRDQYNISWSVQSHSPIREYRLFYRQHDSINDIPYQRHNDRPSYTPNSYYSQHMNELERQNEWQNIVIPQQINLNNHLTGGGSSYHLYGNELASYHMPNHNMIHSNIIHHASHLLKNLRPATHYEARVQARNDHGWNQLSIIFQFTTRSEDMEQEPSAQPAVLKTAGVMDKDSANYRSNAESMSNIAAQTAKIIAVSLCLLLAL